MSGDTRDSNGTTSYTADFKRLNPLYFVWFRDPLTIPGQKTQTDVDGMTRTPLLHHPVSCRK